MIITCENCSTSFKLDESLLNRAGSKVRCSNCKTVFLAYPPSSSQPSETSDTRAEAGDAGHESAGESADHATGEGAGQPFEEPAFADTAEQAGDGAVSDDVLPETLLDMDEDTIAQMLKLDETPREQAAPESAETPQADGDAMLDLPLDLDLDFGEDAASVTGDAEEIDLSELEQVLEQREITGETDEVGPEQELKLAMDEADEAPAETGEVVAVEPDLSEVEQLGEEGDTSG
jgi:predicted Zn finger-like uncharacterized protein